MWAHLQRHGLTVKDMDSPTKTLTQLQRHGPTYKDIDPPTKTSTHLQRHGPIYKDMGPPTNTWAHLQRHGPTYKDINPPTKTWTPLHSYGPSYNTGFACLASRSQTSTKIYFQEFLSEAHANLKVRSSPSPQSSSDQTYTGETWMLLAFNWIMSSSITEC